MFNFTLREDRMQRMSEEVGEADMEERMRMMSNVRNRLENDWINNSNYG
jgi:hypothetical protein